MCMPIQPDHATLPQGIRTELDVYIIPAVVLGSQMVLFSLQSTFFRMKSAFWHFGPYSPLLNDLKISYKKYFDYFKVMFTNIFMLMYLNFLTGLQGFKYCADCAHCAKMYYISITAQCAEGTMRWSFIQPDKPL